MTTKQEATEREELPTRSEVGKRSGGCLVDKMVGKWGPYRYHVKRVGKKQIWTYLGKVSELVREKEGAQ